MPSAVPWASAIAGANPPLLVAIEPAAPILRRPHELALRLLAVVDRRQVTMAVTGLLLFGFVIAHLLGNLQLFEGARGDQLTRRCCTTSARCWVARLGLWRSSLHVATAIRLSRANKAARPVAYARRPCRASFASCSMVLSGLSLLASSSYHPCTSRSAVGPDFQKKAAGPPASTFTRW